MADRSLIEWTDTTWNPITGCGVVSPGCTNCYAMKLAARLEAMGVPIYAGLTRPSKAGPVWTGAVRAPTGALTKPLRWRKPRRIFVNSMSDLFHEAVPVEMIDRVFAVMALAPQHQFQVLTKRSARMREYFADIELRRRVQSHAQALSVAITGRRMTEQAAEEAEEFVQLATLCWPLPNVWLGVSVEDQARADERIPDLLATPAAVRWISAEPLLGPVDLTHLPFPKECDCEDDSPTFDALTASVYCPGCCEGPEPMTGGTIDWVVGGGESGPGARPMHPDWARSLRDQCAAAGVPFLFKQWGEWAPIDAWAPADRRPQRAIDAQGDPVDDDVAPEDVGGCRFMRIGKKAAGRLLDGALHDAFPQGGAA